MLSRGKSGVIEWLMDMKLIANNRLCPQCDSGMKLVECFDRSDGWKWECRKQIRGKRHTIELSIRKGSWSDSSNLPLEKIL